MCEWVRAKIFANTLRLLRRNLFVPFELWFYQSHSLTRTHTDTEPVLLWCTKHFCWKDEKHSRNKSIGGQCAKGFYPTQPTKQSNKANKNLPKRRRRRNKERIKSKRDREKERVRSVKNAEFHMYAMNEMKRKKGGAHQYTTQRRKKRREKTFNRRDKYRSKVSRKPRNFSNTKNWQHARINTSAFTIGIEEHPLESKRWCRRCCCS